jgi:DNA polymerase-1
MRINGVRVDIERAEIISGQLKEQHARLLKQLSDLAGFPVDPNENASLTRLCEQTGIQPLLTDAGRNSFTANWLKEQEHPAFKKVTECRRCEKVERDFVTGVVLNSSLKGRIHSQFHQLKRSKDSGEADSSEDGTRSGRFSSTNPNLQQIPIRDKVLGPLIRSLFIPEDGEQWFCGDFAGQEPRILAHYAAKAARHGMLSEKGAAAAEELLAEYIRNPGLDYHQKVADMTSLDRDVAKPLNLMLVYGAGMKKVALTTGWITRSQYFDKEFKLPDNVVGFFTKYHDGVPFVKELLKASDNLGQLRGYVTTYLGRRRHFDLWLPRTKEKGDFRATEPLPLGLARERWPDEVLVRADTRKALNAVIQGSAADAGKLALRDLGRAGFLPQILVHDEVNKSIAGGIEEARAIWSIMKNAAPLLLPTLVDAGLASNWSEAKTKMYKLQFEEAVG